MRAWLLTLRYDGHPLPRAGRVQPNGVTVQQVMQDAVERLTGVRSGLTGCSRTDAGVHANMFCCTLDTACPLRGTSWAAALNAHLPADVAVYGCREVPADFHPRYMAAGKRYVYRIWNAPARNPFWQGYALHRQRRLDERRMDEAAAAYCGTHDFTAFCSAGSAVEDRVRTVRRCGVSRQGDLVTFTVEADGFLYNMVRIMVGTLLDMDAGRIPWDALPAILLSRDRTAGATAPACGLYLDEVVLPRTPPSERRWGDSMANKQDLKIRSHAAPRKKKDARPAAVPPRSSSLRSRRRILTASPPGKPRKRTPPS